MSITVRDCLELPVFKEAKVVGGASGLDVNVKAVSVIETTDLNEMLADLMQGNEMVISAFFDARNDVPKQCNVIRMLKRGREAAIVLFYVGILVPEIHPDLIQAADEVGLPLICMPPMRNDLSYADVISDVMEMIIQDRTYPGQLINEIISEFSRVDMEQQSIQYVLHLISEKLDCGLIIFDNSLHLLLMANVSNDVYLALDTVVKEFLKQGAYIHQKYGRFDISIGESSTTVFNTLIQIEKRSQVFLYVIDYHNKLNNTIIGQISETIKLCTSIWRYNPIEEAEARLVQAILNKDIMLVNILSNRLKINTADIFGLIVIKQRLHSMSLLDMHIVADKLKHDFGNLAIRALIYEKPNSMEVILLKQKGINSAEHTALYDEIKSVMDSGYLSSVVSITIMDILGLEQLIEESKLVGNTSDVAQLIYPHKKSLTKYELGLAKHCLELTKLPNGEINRFKELLKPLIEYDSTHSNYMIETLAVFLLDAGLNTHGTAKLMFLHPNTVQYRIKKIESILGADITHTPMIMLMSIALAIDRIEKDSRQ